MTEDLLKNIYSGDKRSIAKAITIIENDLPGKNEILKSAFLKSGKAHRIGITGPPGAGKSSLTNCLVKLLTDNGYKVGVIAVDPTSPFTGGALLGDRIRMQEIGMLPGVFIRSMATRGSLGGLSQNVSEACDILDASGKDFILIETVGVGQSELDIAQTADTVLVVLVPESGDAVQAMKAGLMEIADIFVLNKADRQGADGIAATIKNIIHLKPANEFNWTINVLKTISTQNKGIEELMKEINSHFSYMKENGFLQKRRKDNLRKKIFELVNDRLRISFWDDKHKATLEQNLDSITSREKDIYSFVKEIL